MSILHSDNPTTSFGRPRFYNSPHHTTNYFNVSSLTSDETIEEDWILADDAISTEEVTLIDTLFGLSVRNNDSETSSNFTNSSLPSSFFFNGKSHRHLRHLCRQVLVQKVPTLGFRYWDLFIFTLNLLFFVFLLFKCGNMRRKLKHSGGSTMFRNFFVLVYITTILNIIRSGISVTLTMTDQIEQLMEHVIWLSLKVSLLGAELCILIFGLLFGQSDNTRGILCAFLFAAFLAILHTACQSLIDFKIIDQYLSVDAIQLYSYSGLNFWMLSSIFFAIVYLLACFIPLVCCQRRPCVFHRCSFFFYCSLMATLNLAQAFAALLITMDCDDGICLADFVTLFYFTFFPPLVYFTFLRGSTRSKQSRGLFSYRTHKNDLATEANGYYPRFSGLISPSYDDLFDYDRIMQNDTTTQHLDNLIHLNFDFYNASEDFRDPLSSHNIPLMATTTPESTLTSDAANQELNDMSTSSESRPIIRAPVVQSNNNFGSYAGQRQNGKSNKSRNLSVRTDGQLTFSTTSPMN
ncbi:UPF0359 membrane protein [Aphelenchoides besseyi]|nr:UPF0359 membrane protein [Aphelenchoides besseyi]